MPSAPQMFGNPESPSSRRAWIEISQQGFAVVGESVALLAEGVDRNIVSREWLLNGTGSPSSRRAWIEISSVGAVTMPPVGRPPRGGRG